MIASQRLKGTLDLAVLAVLAREDCYGTEIVQRLRDAGIEDIAPKPVYATLARLAHEGCVTSYKVVTNRGQPIFHGLTAAGRRRLRSLSAEWRTFRDAMESVVG